MKVTYHISFGTLSALSMFAYMNSNLSKSEKSDFCKIIENGPSVLEKAGLENYNKEDFLKTKKELDALFESLRKEAKESL